MKLAENGALMAGGGKELVTRVVATAGRILERGRQTAMSSPQMANLIQREIQNLSRRPDPYSQFKRKEMALAREVSSRLRDYVGSDLCSRVGFAVLGNSLDFFKDPEKGPSVILGQMRRGLSFFRDDIHRLEAFLLKDPGLILYLTDNAGELYFDLPLYDYIRARARKTVLVVKGGPSLNDLTRAELRAAGLEDRFQEVTDTGMDGAGIDWVRVTPRFMELVQRAELIVSKGMANFETIYPENLPTPVFFIFKVKCPPIQDYLQAPIESFMAFWQDGPQPQERAGEES